MKKITAFLTCLALAGCANTGALDNADRNQFVTEFYATVSQVNEVDFESYVGPAMTVGAITGALESADGDRGDIVGGAIVGGFIGGLFTAIFEGSTRGYEYHLNAIDGDLVTVVLDYNPAQVGDCVKVRVSSTVNVYLDTMESCMDAQFN